VQEDEGRPYPCHQPSAPASRGAGDQKGVCRLRGAVRSDQRGQAPGVRLPQRDGALPHLGTDESRPRAHLAPRAPPDEQTGQTDPRRFQKTLRPFEQRRRKKPVFDLLPDRRPSRMHREGHARPQAFHDAGAEDEPRAGAGVYPDPGDLFGGDVLHRDGSADTPKNLCRKRYGAQREAKTDRRRQRQFQKRFCELG